MAPRDPLRHSDDAPWLTRGRRRVALGFGLLLVAVILVALVLFAISHLETREPAGLFGARAAPPALAAA